VSRDVQPDSHPDDVIIISWLVDPDPIRSGEGMVMVNAKYRLPVMRTVRHRCPYLRSDELPDVWSRTLISLARKVEDGTFETTGSLTALLTRIAVYRGIDLYRKRSNGRVVPLSMLVWYSANVHYGVGEVTPDHITISLTLEVPPGVKPEAVEAAIYAEIATSETTFETAKHVQTLHLGEAT
jgi:DNA-directed RNA polymerase specialized sigma24 family protein